MKHWIFTLLFGCLIGTAAAQTSKGQWMLGSTIGVSSVAPLTLTGLAADNHAGVSFQNTTLKSGGIEERTTSTLVSIAPAAGYFFVDGLMIGLNANFAFFNAEGNNTTILGVTPTLRYYLNKASKVRPFAEVRGGITYLNIPDGVDDTYPVWGGRGGAAFILNEKVSLDLFLDYSYSSYNQSRSKGPDTTNSVFGFGVGFSFFL